MGYFWVVAHESWVALKYAIFPTIVNLLLAYIKWNYITVISIIKLFVFVNLIYHEDQRTGSMHFKFLFLKIATAVSIYYLAYSAAETIQEKYLPDSPLSLSMVSDGHTNVKVTKAKAKTMLLFPKNSRSFKHNAIYFAFRILVEYMLMSSSVAEYRVIYLVLVFLVYGTIQLIIWHYLPEKKKDQDTDDSDDSDDSSDNEDN